MCSKAFRNVVLFVALLLSAVSAKAGVDLSGPVQLIQVAPDGKLWFQMNTTPAATYCQTGWNGFTMYIPKDDPNYQYYFALLVAAVTKSKSVYVANISMYNGTTPCDITKTGYGLILVQ